LHLWDSADGREHWHLSGKTTLPQGRRALAFSPDGKMVGLIHETGARAWDVRTGTERPLGTAARNRPRSPAPRSHPRRELAREG
jgi:hypothetical protein